MLATNSSTSRPTRSLAISPNLDALLEHEERVRGPIQIPAPQRSQVLSPPVSPGNYNNGVRTSVVGRGLPPPPRGNRRPWSPRSTLGDGDGTEGFIGPTCAILFQQHEEGPEIEQQPKKQEGEGLPSSRTNPYINPAPTLEGVGHGKGREGRPSERPRSDSRPGSLLDKRFNNCRAIVDLFPDTIPHKTLASRHPPHPNKPKRRHERKGECSGLHGSEN